MSPRGLRGTRRPWWLGELTLDHLAILLCAAAMFGFGLIAGHLAHPDQPIVVDLEAAMAVGPPEGPGGRLDPDYRDLVISTLQHALDSAAREGTAALLRPPTPPCRVEIDCDSRPEVSE